jgi:hypothetical protein
LSSSNLVLGATHQAPNARAVTSDEASSSSKDTNEVATVHAIEDPNYMQSFIP